MKPGAGTAPGRVRPTRLHLAYLYFQKSIAVAANRPHDPTRFRCSNSVGHANHIRVHHSRRHVVPQKRCCTHRCVKIDAAQRSRCVVVGVNDEGRRCLPGDFDLWQQCTVFERKFATEESTWQSPVDTTADQLRPSIHRLTDSAEIKSEPTWPPAEKRAIRFDRTSDSSSLHSPEANASIAGHLVADASRLVRHCGDLCSLFCSSKQMW